MKLHQPTPSRTVEPDPASPAEPSHVDLTSVDELTDRLPTSELIKIIKGALACGKRNLPFTESELVRAMTFGEVSTYVRVPPDRARRGTSPTRR
jgi:hypothetical protein